MQIKMTDFIIILKIVYTKKHFSLFKIYIF